MRKKKLVDEQKDDILRKLDLKESFFMVFARDWINSEGNWCIWGWENGRWTAFKQFFSAGKASKPYWLPLYSVFSLSFVFQSIKVLTDFHLAVFPLYQISHCHSFKPISLQFSLPKRASNSSNPKKLAAPKNLP